LIIHERRPVVRPASKRRSGAGEVDPRYWDDFEEPDEFHPLLLTAIGGLLIPLLLTALLFFGLF
jgi:hypothetical protein